MHAEQSNLLRDIEMDKTKNIKVKKHDERPDLTGEHPFGDMGQLILLVIFILVLIADIFFFGIMNNRMK